jgi:YgiT-type zinc finger domain-containing protein
MEQQLDIFPKAETSIPCPACGSTDVALTSIRLALWQGERLVVVDDLPALCCRTCREQFLDDRTAMLLDLMRGDSLGGATAARLLTVPVYSLDDLLAVRAAKSVEVSL